MNWLKLRQLWSKIGFEIAQGTETFSATSTMDDEEEDFIILIDLKLFLVTYNGGVGKEVLAACLETIKYFEAWGSNYATK